MRSRPVRLAAQIRSVTESEIEDLFVNARVLVRLEPGFERVSDARRSFLLAVNQILRFCPHVSVQVDEGAGELLEECDPLCAAIYGEGHAVERAKPGKWDGFDAILNVGRVGRADLPWTVINSAGWIARAAVGRDRYSLPWQPRSPNAIGALGAACLGVGNVFLRLIGRDALTEPFEMSLLTYEVTPPGTLGTGPDLPDEALNLDAFLIGCGAVTNGWAYAIKELPVKGRLEAVDRESLRDENLGPYVASRRESLGRPKAEIIRDLLAPAIVVTPRPEEFEFFRLRLAYGLSVPPLIVNGLDNVETRHAVQRLWPRHLVDMAAGGMTLQVIVKSAPSNGLCLLQALTRPPHEESYAERLARETGLRVERIISDPTAIINQEDVEAAPPDMREDLEHACRQGRQLCGRISEHNLGSSVMTPNFAPAVPFVTAFAGIVGAAETMRYLMGLEGRSLHLQYDFRSNRARALSMICAPNCECRKLMDKAQVRTVPQQAGGL